MLPNCVTDVVFGDIHGQFYVLMWIINDVELVHVAGTLVNVVPGS